MNHMSSQSSKQVAIHNYQDCVQHIPNRLVKREKHFLKIVKKHNDDPFRALHKLFYFMDNLFDFVRPYTPCKKGCTLCCAIPISISELEIQMIEKATLTKRISIPAAPGTTKPMPFSGRRELFHLPISTVCMQAECNLCRHTQMVPY